MWPHMIAGGVAGTISMYTAAAAADRRRTPAVNSRAPGDFGIIPEASWDPVQPPRKVRVHTPDYG